MSAKLPAAVLSALDAFQHATSEAGELSGRDSPYACEADKEMLTARGVLVDAISLFISEAVSRRTTRVQRFYVGDEGLVPAMGAEEGDWVRSNDYDEAARQRDNAWTFIGELADRLGVKLAHEDFGKAQDKMREAASLCSYAEQLACILRGALDAGLLEGELARLANAALAKNPAPNFSAAVPTTTPCNEQCEPNGCADCPLDVAVTPNPSVPVQRGGIEDDQLFEAWFTVYGVSCWRGGQRAFKEMCRDVWNASGLVNAPPPPADVAGPLGVRTPSRCTCHLTPFAHWWDSWVGSDGDGPSMEPHRPHAQAAWNAAVTLPPRTPS